MPCDYSKYPVNWKTEIRPRILDRDKHCCCECGVSNYAVGFHGTDGNFWTVEEIMKVLEDSGCDLFSPGEPLAGIPADKKPIRIVLTIAHMNHDITDNRDENLKALCQKHHLAHDKELHQKNSRQTNENKKGLQKLF